MPVDVKEFELPSLEQFVSENLALIYGQYQNRYWPDGSKEPPSSRTENNVPQFIGQFFDHNTSPDVKHLYDPYDVIEQAFEVLRNGFNIDKAVGTELDNIGRIINQPRPFLERQCYMDFTFTTSTYRNFKVLGLACKSEIILFACIIFDDYAVF